MPFLSTAAGKILFFAQSADDGNDAHMYTYTYSCHINRPTVTSVSIFFLPLVLPAMVIAVVVVDNVRIPIAETNIYSVPH